MTAPTAETIARNARDLGISLAEAEVMLVEWDNPPARPAPRRPSMDCPRCGGPTAVMGRACDEC